MMQASAPPLRRVLELVSEMRALVRDGVFKNDSKLAAALVRLAEVPMTFELLQESKAGVYLNKELRPLLSSGSPALGAINAIIVRWKEIARVSRPPSGDREPALQPNESKTSSVASLSASFNLRPASPPPSHPLFPTPPPSPPRHAANSEALPSTCSLTAGAASAAIAVPATPIGTLVSLCIDHMLRHPLRIGTVPPELPDASDVLRVLARTLHTGEALLQFQTLNAGSAPFLEDEWRRIMEARPDMSNGLAAVLKPHALSWFEFYQQKQRELAERADRSRAKIREMNESRQQATRHVRLIEHQKPSLSSSSAPPASSQGVGAIASASHFSPQSAAAAPKRSKLLDGAYEEARKRYA
jgi:hypothetical protein